MQLDTATILAFVLGFLIPHVSSLVSNTKLIPVWAGGYVTALLAAATGFCSEWAQALADNTAYSVTDGLSRALGAFIIAALTRVVVTKNTPTDAKLIDLGASRANRRGGKPAPDGGAYAPEHEAA